jgi:hypothetical protein
MEKLSNRLLICKRNYPSNSGTLDDSIYFLIKPQTPGLTTILAFDKNPSKSAKAVEILSPLKR